NQMLYPLSYEGLVSPVGLEPTIFSLRGSCSTLELWGPWLVWADQTNLFSYENNSTDMVNKTRATASTTTNFNLIVACMCSIRCLPIGLLRNENCWVQFILSEGKE